MTERGNGPRLITRRGALMGTALALGAAATGTLTRRAAAQQKINQSVAKYQDKPNGNDHCEICANFQPPSACNFVEGQINPKGWCQLFTPKG